MVVALKCHPTQNTVQVLDRPRPKLTANQRETQTHQKVEKQVENPTEKGRTFTPIRKFGQFLSYYGIMFFL